MGRLKYLDALRGVAAIAVVFQHALEYAGVSGGNLNLGRFGVLLFFLLSGYVVPFSLKGDRPLRQFAISRFFRLYPAYWASLVAVALVSAVSPETFFANATMLQRALGSPDAIGVYWSLFFELVFYGIVALLFIAGMPTRAIGALAVLFVCLSLTDEGPAFLSFMLAGTLLRKATLEQDKVAVPWAVIVLSLLVVRSGWTAIIGGVDGPGFAGAVIPAVAVFLAALKYQPRSRAFEWMGKVSYSTYLFHGVVLLTLPMFWAPAYVATTIAGSLLLASASYRWIETPSNEAGKRFSKPSLSREPVPA